MNLEQFERAKCVKAIICSEERKIKNLEKLKTNEEIMIVNSNSKVYEALKRYIEDNEEILKPMYFVGNLKDDMLNVAIESSKKRLNEYLQEFEEI